MKKTRKQKREEQKNNNMFFDLVKVTNHYFRNFLDVISSIPDTRHQSYIIYSPAILIIARIMAHCCHLSSMNQYNHEFNNDNCICNIYQILNMKNEHSDIPHGDTINNYLKSVDVEALKGIMTYMAKTLIANKVLNRYRIDDKYFQVTIDGVQIHSGTVNRTEGSLITHHKNGTITYHNNVLLASIVAGNMIIPIDFEWIENAGEEYDKQDCEIKASKRLFERIYDKFPKLKICINGDGLYLCEPVIKTCIGYNWKYIFTYKEKIASTIDASTIDEFIRTLDEHNDLNKKDIGKDGIVYHYEYYENVEYRNYKLNYVKLGYNGNDNEKKVFSFLTDLSISEKNYRERVDTGRRRWKIENKGFNDQKNHGYHLRHALSYNANAMKAHYVLLLVAQVIMQLLEQYERSKKLFDGIKYMAIKIKEAFKGKILDASELLEINLKFQIRFDLLSP